MNKTKIYMITHKKVNFIPPGITPLYVGNGNNDDNYLRDNTGNNISKKNNNYCELTGLYWIWKNENSDIVGLCHYRRFFGKKIKDIYNEKDKRIEQILKTNDVIVPEKWLTIDNVYDVYKKEHYSSDFDEIERIIMEKYPDYLDSFNEVMTGHYTYICNMFICKKNLINEYCSWLFDILFELEKRIDISNRDNYQKRVYGFLSERLLTVWILKNKLTVYEAPLYLKEASKIYLIKRFIKRQCVKIILKIKGGIK